MCILTWKIIRIIPKSFPAYHTFCFFYRCFRRLLLTQYQPEIRKQILTISKTPIKEAKGMISGKRFWNYSDYFPS